MLKQTIKKIIGQQNITAAKQRLKFVKDERYLQRNSRIRALDNSLLYSKFSQQDRHVFFGYYDIQQLDFDEERMLVHVVNKKANAHKDRADLGYYDVRTKEFVSFASTSAWCWQQGSRLRWHPTDSNKVLFNDVENGTYITRIFDLEKREETCRICNALYDMETNMSYGLSLNFSRLQRLRPGYGYSALQDKTAQNAAPEDDGVFYVDIERNSVQLLISLASLSREVSDSDADQHYINHISISPNGKKFMFFHIWTLKGDTHWRTRLCVYDLESAKMDVLEKEDRVSHYAWKNDEVLVVTCWDKNKEQYYCTYDLKNGKKTILQNDQLRSDGHPTILRGETSFISDTYPLNHDMQTLFEYSIEKDIYRPIIELYSDARLYDEKRCDLHPRVSRSEKYISVDTTCENGCRQVMLLQNWR